MAIGATAIWRVRPSGSNTNGGGYDPGIAGAATDYSQQNAAQASGSHGTATGTTNFADTIAAAFTAAMVGNAIWIASGAGFTVGAYFVTAFVNASNVTLDRSPGTGTVAVWKLGGGWADPQTNTSANIVPGNTVYILGSGTPNPAAYTFDFTSAAQSTPVSGDAAVGMITFANDPLTPGYKAPPDTTGGMPVIKTVGNIFVSGSNNKYAGLYFVVNGTTNAGQGVIDANNGFNFFLGCVIDQNSNDVQGFRLNSITNAAVGCEVFTSVVPGSAGAQDAIVIGGASFIDACNVHDVVGIGVNAVGGSMVNCIVAKCQSDGIQINSGNTNVSLVNNTIDGNLGNGINVVSGQPGLPGSVIINNIISNHNQAAMSGITVGGGTAGANSLVQMFIDYNSFYNNTANYTTINAGPHDTALGVNPYVGQATENYTLA